MDGGVLEHYEALIIEKDRKISRLNEKVKKFEDKIKQLTDQLAWLRCKFWKASSEKYMPADPSQRKIDFDRLDVLPEEEETIKAAASEIITYKRNKGEHVRKQPVRLPLQDHLRREEEIIEPEGVDENWVRIGEEVTEQLEQKTGELYVRRINRHKYALKKDLQLQQELEVDGILNKTVMIAPLPFLPLPRSNAGPSLLSKLLMGKYMYHLPFYRQISLFKLEGVRIPASTVNDWFAGCGDLLRALYYRLKEIVFQSD
jgi:transposase